MPSRDSAPVIRNRKKGISLLLCFSTAGLFVGQPLAIGNLINSSNDDKLAVQGTSAFLVDNEKLSLECANAIRRSHEVAPEVLALASWPLDSTLPSACNTIDGGSTQQAMEIGAPAPPDSGGASALVQNDIQKDSSNIAAFSQVPAPNPLGNNLVALADSSLDEIRGGFELADSNLKFSFGIERVVFVNGELVASSILNVKDLQLATGGGAPQVAISTPLPGTVGVIQNGSGNEIAAQFSSNLAGTVIQNTLNNQKIQNITTINATVNSAQMMRAISVQSAVQLGLVNSLRR
jgi:hypothetical protein